MSDLAYPTSSLTPAEAWSRLLDHARQDLTEQTFRTWLEPTEALRFDGNTIVVGAPDQFAADWNDSKHSQLLSAYAPDRLGRPVTVVFKVHEERKTRPQMDLFVAPPASRQRPAIRMGRTSRRSVSDTRSSISSSGNRTSLRPPRRRPSPRRPARLQSALPLRRHGTRQDPPHASSRP